ncbi:MAG TPA: pilus assembly protein TadG-related protein, partial [Chloroflexota bacterium]|nr:pilus assembly protein TadG-related protein [Chloroflexota bacterium]
MGTTDTCGTRPAAAARRRHGVLPGQAYIFIALSMPVLCGMLALAVDVGTTTARYQALQHAAENAAHAGAYALYGSRIGATSSLTDTGVWNAMTTKLTAQGLTVMNAPGGSVPSDPCRAPTPYLTNQVAMTATYLDAMDNVITQTDNTSWVVGSGSIPPLARGVSVTLGGCQPAGFGGVLGHPTYTIWVNGSAGRWLPGPIYSPTPATGGSAPAIPYAISAAPHGDCSNTQYPSPSTTNYTPTVPLPNGSIMSPDNNDPEELYCTNVYTIGSLVTLYANGVGGGNDYGHDSNFKGYTGGATIPGAWAGVSTGGGNNGPASCPAQVTVPIITGVNHTKNTDYFVVLETAVVNVTSCGNPTKGTIVSVYDPYGFGVVSPAAPPPPAPTNTPVPATLRSSATASTGSTTLSLTIPAPANVQQGDVMIAQLAINNTGITVTAPSGWTQIRVDSGNGIMQALYYHVAGASDPAGSGYTWSWSGTGANAAGSIAAFSGINTSATPVSSG